MHINDNTWVYLIIVFSKKTDMKFIILVSNLKEISPSVFSWKKKRIYKKTTMQFYCQNTIRPKQDTKLCLRVEKWSRSIYHIFLFLHKACWILLFVSFSCRIRQCFGLCHVLLFQQTISHMCKRFTERGHCVGRMNVWISCG